MQLSEIKVIINEAELDRWLDGKMPREVFDWFFSYFLIKRGTSSSLATKFVDWKLVNAEKSALDFMRELTSGSSKRILSTELRDFYKLLGKVDVSPLGIIIDRELSFAGIPKSTMVKELVPSFKFHRVKSVYFIQNGFTSLDELSSWLPDEAVFIGFLGNSIKSLSGIHKKIKSCVMLNFDNNPIQEGGVLGLLLIKGLKAISFSSSASPRAYAALKIIERFLRSKRVGQQAVIEAQSELLDVGLEEYAQL